MLIKDQLDNYKLGDCVGSGTLGKVYECYTKSQNALRAMKIIRLSNNTQSGLTYSDVVEMGNRFTINYHLSHDNILKVYSQFAEQVDGTWSYFMVTDRAQCNLQQMIDGIAKTQKWHKIQPKILYNMCFQIANGVGHIHLNNEVVGSLSLHNILLFNVCDNDYSKILLKISDIGHTTTKQFEDPKSSQTQSSDIWDLGCIMFQIFTLQTSISQQIYSNAKFDKMEFETILQKILINDSKMRLCANEICKQLQLLIDEEVQQEYMRKATNNNNILEQIQQAQKLIEKAKNVLDWKSWIGYAETDDFKSLRKLLTDLKQTNRIKKITLNQAQGQIETGTMIQYPPPKESYDIDFVVALELQTKNNELSGLGIVQYKDKYIYVGRIKDGHRSEFGGYYRHDGTLWFMGPVENHFAYWVSMGISVFDNNWYVGELSGISIHENGVFNWWSGAKYQGDFSKMGLDGTATQGVLTLKDGIKHQANIYIGCLGGKAHSTVTLQTGKKYKFDGEVLILKQNQNEE